jgi:pyruvate dehydrogenase E2 component (dihydrolipoamide acetyltransferase)
MAEFRMPSLGADMEAGTLVEWLKKPGEAVKRGDIVAVVETQKGAIEIEIFQDGVLERWLVGPGVEVPVGAPLAMIRGPGEAAGAAPAVEAPPIPAPPPPQPAAPEAAPTELRPTPPPAAGQVRASPAARKLAQERGIDLGRIAGTGPDGAVVLADVEAAPAAASARPAPVKPAGFDFDQMRAAIAAAMSRSKREIPHYYLSDTVDVGAATDFVAKLNAERPPERRLLLGALFVKATAKAAKAFPEFNGAFEGGAFKPSPAVHAGVAIAIRGGGLVAPAIHDAAELALDDLMAAMRDLIARVRAGRFRSSEIADPTITVSSLGERGVEALYGVIYPPQVAIVGFGKVTERPWVVDRTVIARPLATATLAADHRVSDGHKGALFLARIGELLQQPEAL